MFSIKLSSPLIKESKTLQNPSNPRVYPCPSLSLKLRKLEYKKQHTLFYTPLSSLAEISSTEDSLQIRNIERHIRGELVVFSSQCMFGVNSEESKWTSLSSDLRPLPGQRDRYCRICWLGGICFTIHHPTTG